MSLVARALWWRQTRVAGCPSRLTRFIGNRTFTCQVDGPHREHRWDGDGERVRWVTYRGGYEVLEADLGSGRPR